MGAVPDFFLNNKNFGKTGNSDRFSSPSNTYKAKNGYIHIMAGSDDRFHGLVKAMNKKELFNSKLYNTPQKRIINQKKIDRVVNNWTKKIPIKLISKKLSKNNVPWGEVKTFGEFLKTKTAKNFLTNGFTKTKTIKVPKCAINVMSKNTKEKSFIPELGEDSNKILKSLGYSKENIRVLKKKNIT